MIIEKLKYYLTHPLVRELDIDSPGISRFIRQLIQSKPFLKNIYQEWYKAIKSKLPGSLAGPVLELGSGSGFLKEYLPDLITSEILPISIVDVVLDGQKLPFSFGALSGIVMVDVLHHVPNAELFFREASCCLKPGGVIAMVEPWTTPWSSFIYRYLHHEPFDPDAQHWEFPEGGPLSQANSALPWIIFKRDKDIFKKIFPELKIISIELHSPISYLLSGGVSMRSLLPGTLYKACKTIEKLMSPWIGHCAMFSTIVIRRD